MKEIVFSENFKRVGNINCPTPLENLSSILNGRKVFAKLEYKPPNIYSNSIKDRTAKAMIINAYYAGLLDLEKTVVVEPSSGNTGIALTKMLNEFNVKTEIAMPKEEPKEKINYLKSLDAIVHLTDDGLCPRIPTQGKKAIDGAITLAWAIENSPKNNNYYMPYQYGNPANPSAHFHSIGPEIWAQTKGNVDYVVIGIGTGGTAMGISLFLNKKNLYGKLNREIKIIGVMPEMNHHIPGLKNIQEATKPPILQTELFSKIVMVSDEESYKTAFFLHEKGYNIGPSSGANLAGLLKAKEEGIGVVIFPDSNEPLPPNNIPKYDDFYKKFDYLKKEKLEII